MFRKKFKIGFVTTWNIPCGIATYTANLKTSLENNGAKVLINSNTVDIKQILSWVIKEQLDVIHFQYEPGIMPPFENLLQLLKDINEKSPHTKCFITVHFWHPQNLGDLSKYAKMIVHGKYMGEGPTYEIHHGIPEFPRHDKEEMKNKYGIKKRYVIGTCGFIMDRKGYVQMLNELIPYLKIDNDLFFNMVISLHDTQREEGIKIREELLKIAQEVPGQVYIGGDFIPPRELNERLQACDVLISWEGKDMPDTSGAAREMVAAYRPLVLSESTHFREVYENGLGINCHSKSMDVLIDRAIYFLYDPPPIDLNKIAQFFFSNIAKKHLEIYIS